MKYFENDYLPRESDSTSSTKISTWIEAAVRSNTQLDKPNRNYFLRGLFSKMSVGLRLDPLPFGKFWHRQDNGFVMPSELLDFGIWQLEVQIHHIVKPKSKVEMPSLIRQFETHVFEVYSSYVSTHRTLTTNSSGTYRPSLLYKGIVC